MIVDPAVLAKDEKLQRVESLIQGRLDRPIGLAEAAAAAGLELKYFSQYFHERTGVCFKRWLVRRRVDAAKDLLVRPELPIWQISQHVGLEERTFRRLFKESTGVSATRYRRSLIAKSAGPPVADTQVLEQIPASFDASDLFLLVDVVESSAGAQQNTKIDRIDTPPTGRTRKLTEEPRKLTARFGRDRS